MPSITTQNQLPNFLYELIVLSKQTNVKKQSINFEMDKEIQSLMEIQLEKSLDGFTFQIDIYAIKHILKEHGNETKEASRGQVAVQDGDILLIPEILQRPDMVVISGKNKLGNDTITFNKILENKYVVVQEIRMGRKTIALNSMRIFKKTKRTKLP